MKTIILTQITDFGNKNFLYLFIFISDIKFKIDMPNIKAYKPTTINQNTYPALFVIPIDYGKS